ncbi:hypothetical protein G9A89_014455 [Geosiphon pyriformis]|nr:hypothetical protein G9A89_014455 [Geosiphon pyriformis]
MLLAIKKRERKSACRNDGFQRQGESLARLIPSLVLLLLLTSLEMTENNGATIPQNFTALLNDENILGIADLLHPSIHNSRSQINTHFPPYLPTFVEPASQFDITGELLHSFEDVNSIESDLEPDDLEFNEEVFFGQENSKNDGIEFTEKVFNDKENASNVPHQQSFNPSQTSNYKYALDVNGEGNSEEEEEEEEEDDDDGEESHDGFNRLLSKAKEIGIDLAENAGDPHVWDKINMDEGWDQFTDELTMTRVNGIPVKKKKGRKKKSYSPEINHLLSAANSYYIEQDLPSAVEVLQEVLQKNAYVHGAWWTLGMIQEELGNHEKAIQLHLVAAHLTPKDIAEWKRLGLLSKKHNSIHQAIYCFSQALRLDPTDVDTIWDRSILFAQADDNKKALEGFRRLLEMRPHDMNIIREITRALTKLNEVENAIKLYQETFEYYKNMSQKISHRGSIFGYSDINIMAELYISADKYDYAIHCIRRSVRWLQGREKETWWDPVNDDREYDEDNEFNRRKVNVRGRYHQHVKSQMGGSTVTLPLELRVKLGQCRLLLDQIDEGRLHINSLFEYSVGSYVDLYYEVGETFFEKCLYNDALNIYELITSHESTESPIAWSQMGLCHREMGNFDLAAEYFIFAIQKAPESLDVKMALAEVYEEMGETQKALETVNEVLSIREARRLAIANAIADSFTAKERQNEDPNLVEDADTLEIANSSAEASDNGSISIIKKRLEYREIAQAKAQEVRQAKEAEKEKEALALFHKLDLLSSRLSAGDRDTCREFIKTAKILIEDWTSTKAFYPKDKMKRFTGLYNRRGRRRKQGTDTDEAAEADLEEAAKSMEKRLKQQIDGSLEPNAAPESTVQCTHFRGKSFEEWFEFFIKYSITAVTNGFEKEAYSVLKAACAANVFFHNEGQRFILKMILMACGLYGNDYEVVCETARWLCTQSQFRSNPYLVYCASMTSGTDAVGYYAAANSQKYFIRQIKSMHEVIEARVMSQAKPDAIDHSDLHPSSFTPSRKNVALLTLYGHILACARSYVSAIAYYLQSYELAPKDPLVNLCLGVAYLHRSMQRQTDNRQVQIIQGFNFLLKYYDLQTGSQEAEYNLGRAYHQLGLYHMAVSYYKKVLELPSLKEQLRQQRDKESSEGIDPSQETNKDDYTDLKREAAYNLSIIYIQSGSPGLAQILLKKYCTI